MNRKRQAVVLAAAALTLGIAAAARDHTGDQVAALVKDGHILALGKLDAAALAQHAGGSIEQGAEVEQHRRGYVYEVEITDMHGVEWDLEIDAATDKVLKNGRD